MHVRARLFEFARKNRPKNAQLLRLKPQGFQTAAHSKHSAETPLRHTKNSRYCSQTKHKCRMEPAATVTREIVSSRMSPVHGFQRSFPPVRSEGSGAMAVSNVGAYSCVSTPQEPPNSRTRTSPDPAFTSEATPSCCYEFSSSSPPVGEFVVIDGPLPAGVQPLCDFNSSSSSSSAPAVRVR